MSVITLVAHATAAACKHASCDHGTFSLGLWKPHEWVCERQSASDLSMVDRQGLAPKYNHKLAGYGMLNA